MLMFGHQEAALRSYNVLMCANELLMTPHTTIQTAPSAKQAPCVHMNTDNAKELWHLKYNGRHGGHPPLPLFSSR